MSGFEPPEACPTCHRPESWSVWVGESGAVMGTCHRALCSHGTWPLQGVARETIRKPEARHYTRPIRFLNDNQRRLIHDKFGISPDELDGYSEGDDRFILGVYGPKVNDKRGVIAYSLSGAKPKSLTYNERPGEPFIHYTGSLVDNKPNLVIVEDWFSAEKVETTGSATGAAIMGTHLGQAEITELAGVAKETGAKTWVALDRDAYMKTLLYLSRFREQFPLGLYAWNLRKDLKYETTERIIEALGGKTDFGRDDERPESV